MQPVPDGRVFGLDMQTLISIGIQLLNAIILALALSFILYKPVKAFLQKRTEKIQKNIDDSETAMQKAKDLMAEYETKLKDIDKERLEILEAARQKAFEESRKIIEEAREEADDIKKRSMEGVMADKNRLKEETRLYVIELASLMAQRFIDLNMDDETQNKIFDESLTKLEAAKWQS